MEGDEEAHLDAVRGRLTRLQSEHRDLDEVITHISESGNFDQLRIQRLKKRKLILKDQISRLASRLVPDIIA